VFVGVFFWGGSDFEWVEVFLKKNLSRHGKGGIIAHYCAIPPSQPPFIAYNIAQYISPTTPFIFIAIKYWQYLVRANAQLEPHAQLVFLVCTQVILLELAGLELGGPFGDELGGGASGERSLALLIVKLELRGGGGISAAPRRRAFRGAAPPESSAGFQRHRDLTQNFNILAVLFQKSLGCGVCEGLPPNYGI